MIKLHIPDTGNFFNPDQIDMIRGAFDRAVKTCKDLISISAVDVVIYHNPTYVMPETGIGGRTPTTNLINIPVDAKRDLDPEVLYLTICHEMNHAMRQRKFGFPETLFDAIVSEGLADQFEKEINPDKELITYRKDLDKEVVLKGLDNLKKELNNKEYDYFGWFFGKGDYPKYFGYTLGNLIIESYTKSKGVKPSKLVGEETAEFKASIDVVIDTLE